MIPFHSNIRSTPRVFAKIIIGFLLTIGLSNCQPLSVTSTPTLNPTQTPTVIEPVQTSEPLLLTPGKSRGYLTTPPELIAIAKKADQGIEPYQSAVNHVLQWANKDWDYDLNAHENCSSADSPVWNDNGGGTPILYAKALTYHLTDDTRYAEEVKNILESIMTEVQRIDINTGQCRLVFGWGTPELVASADLIEDYWWTESCTGPTGTSYTDTRTGTGNCKQLFQNWLAKNPYYIVSYSAESNKSNWGAAATNTIAYIADYLWDRPDIILVHRSPLLVNGGEDMKLTPSEAYAHANQLAINRMNGYGVEYTSSRSCDVLGGRQQSSEWPPVKSQITEQGIIPEDARREEYCNIPSYNGKYQNYPQIHLGSNIQQCELMLRRGDSSCYDNIDNSDIPDYIFMGPDGEARTTHLYPGRGSIERAIKAVIVDSNTQWRHDSALEVAYRYYYTHHTLPGFDQWTAQLDDRPHGCSQDVCFGTLTHGFSIGNESLDPVPTTIPP